MLRSVRNSRLVLCCALVATSAALAACGGGAMAPGKALSSTVATAAGASLSGQQLEKWLLLSPTVPSRLEANVVVSAWVNNTLIIDATRRKAPLQDSITIDSVIGPDAQRGTILELLVHRESAYPPVSDKQVDSVLDVDRVRVFQQILFRIGQHDDSIKVAAVTARARATLAKIRSGADFTALVKQISDDSASKAHDGIMAPVTRDQMPDRLASVWSLPPDKSSGIITSAIGYHIMRRVTRVQAREPIRQWLRPMLGRHADSLYIDSLSAARHLAVAPDAAIRLRTMALEPNVVAAGGPMVTWSDGGALTAAQVREALLMSAPPERFALNNASDSTASLFLTDQARRQILIAVATHGTGPTDAARRAMTPVYHTAMDSIGAVIGRIPSTGTAGDAATMYIDSMLAGSRRHLALPGALAEVLRNRAPQTVDQSALNGVVQGAALKWQELHKNDSTANGRLVPPNARAGAAPAGAPRPAATKP